VCLHPPTRAEEPNARANGDDNGNGDRREEDQLRIPSAQHEKEIPEESTEQHEHHSSHHDEAELAVSGCDLSKSTRLATHPPKQESSEKRMGNEHHKQRGREKHS